MFEDIDNAYSALLGEFDGRPRVVPGDPACSRVVMRIRSGDPRERMPPGPIGLSQGEVCTITRWVAAGARP